MTIRSMPPASSHLADRPVPAPPPISGRPAAILARKRSSRICRAMRGMAKLERPSPQPSPADAGEGGSSGDLAPGGDQGVSESFVVDVHRQTDQLAVGARAKALFDRGEQRVIGLGVVKGLARLVDRRDAA